ncbi:MAG: site-specific DNA-methyltransferase, partial [Bacilli bacterium]|nr:site-specific DNA-methyltransferase [Bacilli bacterium]
MEKELNIQLYNGDCLEVMKNIPDDSIDLILCDLPYGTVKGLQLKNQSKETYEWDNILPTSNLFKEYERIIKVSGRIILFSQEPYTAHLRNFKAENIIFAYPMIWIKKHFANCLFCNSAPVSYFEDLNVFHKRYDRKNNPLREYSKKIYEFIGLNKAKINKRLGHRKAEHFFRWDTSQFSM